MTDDRVEIPTSMWERLLADRKRLVMILIAVCALLFIGSALGVRLILGAEEPTGGSGVSVLEPLDEPGLSVNGAEQDSETSETPPPTDVAEEPAGETSPPGGGNGSSPVRAARMAYRLSGELFVANEDGSNSVKVATSERGGFALSPDGTVLAWIDATAATLHLADVASGSDRVIGPAEDVAPAWAPDSSYVAYTVQSPARLEVRRVGRDGSGDAPIGAGHSPAISNNGRVVVYLAGAVAGATGQIVVKPLDGVAVTLETVSSCVLFGGDGIIYAISTPSVGSERILTSATNGSGARQLVGATTLGRPVIYTELDLSPDGKHLLYAASGDDGFSRAFISWIVDPSPIGLTVRRDTYPMRFTADGARVLFVEGNAFQGERTSLMRTTTEGLGRAVVVEGAGL